MAFETTITEKDLDANSQHLVHGFRADNQDREPDLTVDGLSDSIFSRLLGLLGMLGLLVRRRSVFPVARANENPTNQPRGTFGSLGIRHLV